MAFEHRRTAQDAFRALWMQRLERLLPIPTIVLVGTTALHTERPWHVLAIGLVYVLANVAVSHASHADAKLDPGGIARHAASALPVLAMAWVAGPDQPGWLLGLIPCFVGALSPTRQSRLVTSTVFVSAPLIGSALAGSSAQHLLLIGALLSCVAVLSAGLFEIMHTVWEEAEERREKLEETTADLRVALRTRENFLANITHELRTPLNGVLGATELLLEGELAPEQRGLTEMARTSGWGLLRILDDILDTTALASGGLNLQSVPVDVNALSRELCERARAGLTKPITLTLNTHRLPPQLLGDPARLRQVLGNLIGNALKFTERGRVDVDLEWEEDTLRVSVQDTGQGIPAERLRDLTEAFTQADESTTRAHGGAGLGLHLSNALILEMGGQLSFESELGKGSHFRFEIPAPRPPQA